MDIETTKTDKADDKRTRILDAAFEVFAEKGYEKASISEIVKRADIAKGTFYLYFESKASLTEAVADQLQDTMLTRVTDILQSHPNDLYNLIQQIIHAFYEIAESYGNVFDIIAAETKIFQVQQVERIKAYPTIMSLLKSYQDEGIINAEVDLSIIVRLVDGVMTTLCRDCLISKMDVDKDHYIHQTTSFLCRALT